MKGKVVTLTPEQIRATQFEQSRRGYDRADVERFLERVAAVLEEHHNRYEQALARLDEARTVEANLRSTLVAMSQAREEILDAAQTERAALLEQTDSETARARARAEDEAAEIVMDARRAALDVIAEARCDADYLLTTAHAAVQPLTARVNEMRAVVRRTENLMRGLASGALGELAQAHLMLDEAPASPGGDVTEMQIVFSDAYDADDDDGPDVVSPLPAAVDRLLTHLREIG